MEKETRYLNKIIKPIFVSNNLDFDTITSFPINSGDPTRVKYECVCGTKTSRSAKMVKKKPLCDYCIPRKKTGAKAMSVNNFIELLQSKGYELTSSPSEVYENTKSLMTVTNIATGEKHKTSYNRFQSGHHKSMKEACKTRKLDTLEVKRRVEEAGFEWIEDTVYVDKSTPFDVICHCKNKFSVAIGNIHENRVGCNNYYRYNKKYPWNYIEGMADKNGCIIITSSDAYKGIETILNFRCSRDSLATKNVKSFLKSPWCIDCSFIIRETTNLQKYGAKNYLASEEGKKSIEKFWLENYGVSHNMKVAEIQKKAQQTCSKNHGVQCVLVKDGVRNAAINSVIQKYDNHTFLHTIEYKKVMQSKYGCDHNVQNAVLFSKMQKSSYKAKTYVFPSGKSILVHGYEPMCIDMLLKNGINEKDIVTSVKKVPKVIYWIKDKNESSRYFMDGYIKSEDKAIEVKSVYTYNCEKEKNEAKWIEASKVCKGGIDVYVFGRKGEFLARKSILNGQVVQDSYCLGGSLLYPLVQFIESYCKFLFLNIYIYLYI